MGCPLVSNFKPHYVNLQKEHDDLAELYIYNSCLVVKRRKLGRRWPTTGNRSMKKTWGGLMKLPNGTPSTPWIISVGWRILRWGQVYIPPGEKEVRLGFFIPRHMLGVRGQQALLFDQTVPVDQKMCFICY